MIILTNQEIDKIIEEDIPLIDLTIEFLDIKGDGIIRFYSRHKSVICGTEEVIQIFRRLGIKEENYVFSGSVVEI